MKETHTISIEVSDEKYDMYVQADQEIKERVDNCFGNALADEIAHHGIGVNTCKKLVVGEFRSRVGCAETCNALCNRLRLLGQNAMRMPGPPSEVAHLFGEGGRDELLGHQRRSPVMYIMILSGRRIGNVTIL